MRRFILLFKILLFAGMQAGQAQSNISGLVTDSSSKAAVSFANVALRDAAGAGQVAGTVADSTGRFELPAVAAGSYTLQVSALGYLTLSQPVTVPATDGDLRLGTLMLQQDVTLLQSVIIKGEKAAIRYQSDRTVLNVGGSSFYKTSANAADILRKAPGVTVNPDGALLLAGRNSPVIFINGKPIEMSAEEIQAYLNSLPPEAIETIEIITNPSSRYDGQYKGIIDLKLKTDLTTGWKGSLNTSIRQHVYTLADNSLSLSYKTKNVLYSLRAAYLAGDDYYRYNAFQRLAGKNYLTTHTHTRTLNNNPALQAGVSYTLRKNRHLDISFKTYQANRSLVGNNSLTFEDSLRARVLGITQTTTRATPGQRSYALNAAYDMELGNSRLAIFGSVTGIRNTQQEDIQISAGERLTSYWKTRLQNDVLIRTLQTDFVKTLKNAKLEAGAKYAFISTDNDLKYDTLNLKNAFVPDSGRSNRFLYDEHITAGYLSYAVKYGSFDLSLSLRAEHTHTAARAVTEGSVQKRGYVNWLPGASISREINKSGRISLAFTRRITRPGFDQLNPFRFYLSPLNYRVGNPYLRPSLISSLQLTFSWKDLNTNVIIGREKDFMTRYPEYNRITNELLYLGMNLPFTHFASAETGYTFPLTSWWKTTHNIGVYYNKQQMPYLGKTYAIGVTDFSVNGSQVFTLPRGITADLTYRYKSKSGNSLYIFKPYGSVDIGLQRNWLRGKLTSKLNFYDIFYSQHISLVFREKAIIDNQLRHRAHWQRAVLTLSFQFGNATYRTKDSKTSDEERRAGS